MICRIIAVLLTLFLSDAGFATQKLIPVQLGIMEALAEESSTSSQRYKEGLAYGLAFALGENDAKLARCGYHITAEFAHFSDENEATAFTHAKALKKDGAWMVYGPRRSKHYLLVSKALGETVGLVSPLASASEVIAKDPPHFTMAYSNAALADAAAKIATDRGYGDTYAVVLDEGCDMCADFAKAYESTSSDKQLFKTYVSRERPDLAELLAQVKELNPKYILLPNYSRLSGAIMGHLGKAFPKLKYIGGDGWGDGRYGFIQSASIPPTVNGMCFRVGLPEDELTAHYRVHSLGRQWQGEKIEPPATGFMLIEFVRTFTDILCQHKPKDRQALIKVLKAYPTDFFRTSMGVSLYDLRGNDLSYGGPAE